MPAFFAVCPTGLEHPLKLELEAIGVSEARPAHAGIEFDAEFSMALRVLLWSRIASRVLMPLKHAPVNDPDQLYQLAKSVDWRPYFQPDQKFGVHAKSRHPNFKHSQFAALRVKDAIMDQLRPNAPTPDPGNAEIHVYAFVDRKQGTVGIDIAGRPMHQRGYREAPTTAPLKETLAAAILARADWTPEHGSLCDPFCGSGTLLIEAALRSADVAPGLLNPSFAASSLPQFQPSEWNRLIQEAEDRRQAIDRSRLPTMFGFDQDPQAVRASWRNARAAGIGSMIEWDQRDIRRFKRPETWVGPGAVVCNPPYGERLDAIDQQLHEVYRLLGDQVRHQLPEAELTVIATADALVNEIDRPRKTRFKVRNGPLDCSVNVFAGTDPHRDLPEGARMVVNRITKNLRRIKKVATSYEAYRVYDADIPEYAVTVDRYGPFLHVQEHDAPREIPEHLTLKRAREARLGIMQALNVDPGSLFIKHRRRQRGADQYGRQSEENAEIWLHEGDVELKVNLSDYLDTGLFLDHRPLREMVRTKSHDKNVLNLFCYTGSISVHAAAGGARSTTSIDLSANYVQWARDNLARNGFHEPAHRVIKDDCLKWLERSREQFDLIILDPPTFSNSKSMRDTLDVQRDQVSLVESCMKLLAPGGRLYFSNNYRRFKLAAAIESKFDVEEITSQTVPPDFSRRRPHRAFVVRARSKQEHGVITTNDAV